MAASRPRPPGDRVFQLPCPARYGGCGGVYPVQVSLQDISTGLSLDSFTTYLIVVPSKVPPARRLRFSFVVPVGATVALGPDGAPRLPPISVSQIDNLAREEALSPGVPLTVDLYGQTLLALARSREHVTLVNKVAYGGLGNLVAAPFSDVDPTRLVRAGLENDLSGQFLRDGAVFTRVLHSAPGPHTSTSRRNLSAHAPWRLWLPRASLTSSSRRPTSSRSRAIHAASVEWPYTLSAPFRIAGSTVEGVQADPVSRRISTGRRARCSGPSSCLPIWPRSISTRRAIQSARGVALVAPESWLPQVTFLRRRAAGARLEPDRQGRCRSTSSSRPSRLGAVKCHPSSVSGCSAAVRALSSPGRGHRRSPFTRSSEPARPARRIVLCHPRPTRRRSTLSTTPSCWQRPPG